MKCIIPLAGPDIFTQKYGLKPAYEIDGEPLLYKTLRTRSWYGHSLNEEDLIFVLRNIRQINELRQFLTSYFPKGQQLIIPDLTQGALMSSLAGTSLITDFSELIVVDLVDILFNSDFSPEKIFNGALNISGIIPYFKSDNPKYSYLELDDHSNVLRTREKEVISNHASAGVYFYRNVSTFLSSVNYSINNRSSLAHNDLLFLSPSFNGIINKENKVRAVEVDIVNEISLLF